MSIFDINGWEFVIILAVAIFVIGPERLPRYVAQLRQWVRQGRVMAESARSSLRDQMGPDFDTIDWNQFDPRQYDPRRIVREAILDPLREDADAIRESLTGTGAGREGASPAADGGVPVKPVSRTSSYDPARPTPWDGDAT